MVYIKGTNNKEKNMWKQKLIDKSKEQELVKNNGAFISRMLAERNIPLEKCNSFLESKYEDLSDPYSLDGVEAGTKLFCKYAKDKEKIVVIGDYDCDGCTSSAMIYELCRVLCTECQVFIPSRFDHGYGLNEKTIKAFKEKIKQPPKLLVVLDCGTNSKKEIEELKEWGVKDVIIIDHHLPSTESVANNATVLINWLLNKEKFNEMCTAGEVFQFVRGVRRLTKRVDPIEFLTYAALGTVADSSPIIGDNRIVVRHGLGEYALSHIRPVGVKILMNSCNILSNHITQTDVAFKITPRINATGRMEKADTAFRLLTEYDLSIANELTDKVNTLNNDRKQLQGVMESQALEKLKKENFTHGVMLKDKNWHIGIMGIVASRVSEESNKPTIVFGYYEGKWKGSGRTVNGINIKAILDTCAHIFERYGGHAGAVGCQLKEEYAETGAKIFDEACKKYISDNSKEACKYFDATLKAHIVEKETALLLNDKLAPYCKDHNPEPIFKLNDINIYNLEIREGDGWRVMSFSACNKEKDIPYSFKWFSPKMGEEINGKNVNLYFTFPQKWDENARFGHFELTVVDIEIL